jgi:hypothetical protein
MHSNEYVSDFSGFPPPKHGTIRPLRRQDFLSFRMLVAFFIAFSLQLLSVEAYPTASIAAQAHTFVFAAGGDIGANPRAEASLRAIPASGAAFFLAIGDLDYDQTPSDAVWCDYVKERVGATFPFQILTGNHEEGSAAHPALNGYVGNHAACLPDHFNSTPLIAGQSGYPANYYFDYPQPQPLLRVIMISADLEFDGVRYEFNRQEQTNYNSLASAIDQAKQADLWVVVATHKNCLTAGEKPCEIGPDLMNLLIEKRVDLVLQGHDHTYQRSKQIALSRGCESVVPGTYNPNCIADDGSDNTYSRGAGTVFVISGVTGRCCNDINASDPEVEYFAKTVGSDGVNTNGFVAYTVSPTRIDAQVVNSVGTWRDSFSLAEDGSIPVLLTAIPSSTVVVIPTVTSSSENELSFNPEADSYVDTSKPSTNFGSSTALRADGSPVVNSYLRFNVQNVTSTITSVTLRFYANSASSGGLTVQHVADSSWEETTITSSNAPTISETVGSAGELSAGTWVSIDVTALVRGNGLVSMALTSTNDTAISISSRDGANPPQLIINVSELLSATDTPTDTFTEMPTETPTDTATAAFTETPTPILTDTPNDTSTNTPTNIPTNTSTDKPPETP